MKILSISARNFKAINFDHALAPITLIVGPNYSGKTAVPLAIRLALTGYLPPPIGTKGIYRLAGNPDNPGEMSIKLMLEKERTVSWKWTRDAAGKVKTEGGVPADLLMPPLLSEPRQFFAMTGAERVNTIFASCPGAGKDLPTRIMTGLNSVQGSPAKVRQEILEDVATWLGAAFKNQSPQTACAKFIDFLKTTAKTRADEAKATAGALAGFLMPATKPADVSAELESARQALAKIQVTTQFDRNAEQKNLTNLNGQLDVYSRRYQSVPVEKLVEFLTNELATVAADLAKLQPTPPLDDILDELQAALEEETAARLEVTQFTALINRLQIELQDLTIATCCPTCLTATANWKKKAVDALNQRLLDPKLNLTKETARRDAAAATVAKLNGIVTQTRKTEQEVKMRWQELTDSRIKLEDDRASIEALFEERNRTQATLEHASFPENPDTAVEAHNLTIQIQALQAKQSARDTYDRDMTRREGLESALITATARAEILKAVVKLVTEEQAKATETAFGSVLATARHFTDGLLNSPLEFVDGDLGRRVSNLDLARGVVAPAGSWISHETFSDSEQRIAYVGFAVALAADAPIKLVIVDELATLQPDRKIIFIDRLLQLARKGIIDQAICLEPTGTAYAGFQDVKDIKIISL